MHCPEFLLLCLQHVTSRQGNFRPYAIACDPQRTLMASRNLFQTTASFIIIIPRRKFTYPHPRPAIRLRAARMLAAVPYSVQSLSPPQQPAESAVYATGRLDATTRSCRRHTVIVCLVAKAEGGTTSGQDHYRVHAAQARAIRLPNLLPAGKDSEARFLLPIVSQKTFP